MTDLKPVSLQTLGRARDQSRIPNCDPCRLLSHEVSLGRLLQVHLVVARHISFFELLGYYLPQQMLHWIQISTGDRGSPGSAFRNFLSTWSCTLLLCSVDGISIKASTENPVQLLRLPPNGPSQVTVCAEARNNSVERRGVYPTIVDTASRCKLPGPSQSGAALSTM